MKNFLLVLASLYGVGVSLISAHGLINIDMPELEKAVAVGATNAELRHRMNVAAEGNWILLGNLITVVALVGLKKPIK